MNSEKKRTGRARINSRLAPSVFVVAVALLLAALAFTRGEGARVTNAAAATAAATAPAQSYVRETDATGHSEYLTSLTARALREGFGRDSVELLQPMQGPGRAEVAKLLGEMVSRADGAFGRRLAATDLRQSKEDARILTLTGKSSYLEVYADGTKFRLRGNIDDPRELARARGLPRLSQNDLERAGREFVRTALRDFVRLDKDETLTFLGVRYMTDDAAREKERVGEETVVANIAIFGRELRGVPFVGSGSKIAVWFAGDRSPVGVDVDWPRYRPTGQVQRVLPNGQLRDRVKKTTNSGNAEVTRFACGYVDLGATRRGAFIQSGCSIAYTGRRDGDVFARGEFIPAGTQVVRDPKWPLATLIAAGREVNTDSPEYAAYLAGRRGTPGLSAKPRRENQRGPIRTEP